MQRCGNLLLLTYLDTCWLSLLFKRLIRASSLNVTWHMHYSLQLDPSCEKKIFPEPVFINFEGAQESIPRSRFRQSGGPVRQKGLSYRPTRLGIYSWALLKRFTNSSSEAKFLVSKWGIKSTLA